jgi:Protein of unknown function (DUF3046)
VRRLSASARHRSIRRQAGGAVSIADSVIGVRMTVFWERMNQQFGEMYAPSVAKDQVIAELGGRTVEQALADGEDARTVWRAVCDAFDLPEKVR